MNGSLEAKVALRRRFREALATLSAADRAAGSVQLCQRLRELPIWQQARSILGFHPLPSEPDIWPLLLEALKEGRPVGLPRFVSVDQGYVACRVGGVEDLTDGSFGVREPARRCAELDTKHLDLVLAPGIAFTLNGDRLGRGKGYYDRLLAGIEGFKCGVAFDCQVTTDFPVEHHDIRLNGILTPTRWHPVVRQARS